MSFFAAAPTRRQAALTLLFVAVTVLLCAGLIAAAALAPAPPAVLPLITLTCVGFPMLAALELPGALAALRHDYAMGRMRRHLEALPEVEHPLGL